MYKNTPSVTVKNSHGEQKIEGEYVTVSSICALYLAKKK